MATKMSQKKGNIAEIRILDKIWWFFGQNSVSFQNLKKSDFFLIISDSRRIVWYTAFINLRIFIVLLL